MSLTVGSRLGHYDVTALIGEGGMGQVYRATDTQLGRDVALKILPDAFAADPDRLARFQREAQVLASLNHPGIAQIYGTEEDKTDGTRALVLELVAGPTLADRIAQGPIPVDEALPIAKQIAEAVEAAHEAGVIHRDLKPANIKVREDGTVKVLDFGLAKALDTTPASDPSQSPTLTAAATQMGVILGTAAYMAPEQARGKPVDRRADIWSFGAVLFEMLTGRRVFGGRDVSATLAAVIQSDPAWDALPAETPARVTNLLRRCLEKEQNERIHAVGDVRLAMAGAFETTVSPPSDQGVAPLPTGMKRAIPVKLAVPLAVVVLLAGVGGTWWAMRPASLPPAATMRVEVTVTGLAPGVGVIGAELSPDGTHMAYVVGRGNSFNGLHVRALDEGEDTLLASGIAFSPFFSADGQWVGYSTPNEVRKVPVSGGAPQTVTSGFKLGGTWGPDDMVILGGSDGLVSVSADGGEPVSLTQVGEGESFHALPQVLPGNQAVLFTAGRGAGGASGTSDIEVLDLETGTRSVVQTGSAFGRYTPSGHLVYEVNDALFAAPFDLVTLDVSGSATPIEAILQPGLLGVNRREILTPDRRLILTPLTHGV